MEYWYGGQKGRAGHILQLVEPTTDGYVGALPFPIDITEETIRDTWQRTVATEIFSIERVVNPPSRNGLKLIIPSGTTLRSRNYFLEELNKEL